MRNENFWKWYKEFAAPRLLGRKDTFRQMLEHLDTFDVPVSILETGCIEDPDNWAGNGCSTLIFDKYVSMRDDASTLKSVDIIPEKVKAARSLVGKWTKIEIDDSVVSIRKWAELGGTRGLRLHLLYLDASHFFWENPIPAQIHHHAELMAALPLLTTESMVAVDDSPGKIDKSSHRIDIVGKGALVAQHMYECGADLRFCEYQVGWTRVTPLPFPKTDPNIKELVNRARYSVENGNPVGAEQIYRLILDMCHKPQSGQERIALGEACMFYARVMRAKNKFGFALEWFMEALSADPYAVDYRLDMISDCLVPMGFMMRAKADAERAVRSDPEYGRAWKVMGGVCSVMGDVKGCLEAWDRRLEIEPDFPDALFDRALIAMDTADYDTTRRHCRKIMERGKDGELYSYAVHALAMVAAREHRHEDAVKLYDEAIDLGYKDRALAKWNKSVSLHAIGRFKEAWEAHEYREFTRVNPALFLPMNRFNHPRWKGEPAIKDDGTPAILHVHCEAGAGDNLCLARYLPILKSKGFVVRYEAPADMAVLMRDSLSGIDVVPRAIDYPGAMGMKPFDYHIPIGSVPAVMGTDIDTVPWNGTYLFADKKLAKEYEERIDAKRPDSKIKIGFCWSSGVRIGDGIWLETYGRRKSMHFDDVRELVDTVWLDLHGTPVCLQVGPERAQHEEGSIVDVLPEKPNWSDTTAVIENLDLVVTVDTAVAHLAGAMGKPVWVMCQRDAASWHFLCWRPGASWNERSPWYPTVRVFRQHHFDEPPCFWDDVVRDIKKELLLIGVGQKSEAAE